MRSAFLAACVAAIPASVSAQAIPSGNALILDGSRCSATIGEGGNLRLPTGEILDGKCEGAGTSPTLTDGGRVIEFAVRSDHATAKDRTELAFTDKKSRFLYGRQYKVSFDIDVPASSAVTNDFFYVAQFWQNPTKPPIAGLRIQRGQDHRGTIMARGDGSSPGGRPVTDVALTPGEWVKVAMRIMVKPGDGSCISASVNGSPESSWCGSIGYTAQDQEKSFYRFKFGIYKGSEPSKEYKVRFRNISIRDLGPGWAGR